MTIYGYARISRPQQSIDRQVRNIKAYSPNADYHTGGIYRYKNGSSKMEPFVFPNYKQGDTIIFDSVSRMSRNAEEGFHMYNELFNKGIKSCLPERTTH